MKRKTVLYIGSVAMGDHILSIPFLLQLKEKGYAVVLLKYHPKYFGGKLSYVFDYVSDFLYQNKLFEKTVYIPYNKLQLIGFIVRNLFKFDIVYIPVKTFFATLWARLLGKKMIFAVKNINDNDDYPGIVQGLLRDKKVKCLYEYQHLLQISTNLSYHKKFGITKPFVTIFPSIFERSMGASEWHKVISFLHTQNLTVVLVGGARENRLADDLQAYHPQNIINTCGKTDFVEVMNILSDAKLNISANGGVMRLGHLLNKYNISLHITSGYVTEPPVDNIHSFNVRKYTYPCCKPCEPISYRFNGKKGIPCCVFTGTDREAECKKYIKGEDIIFYIKKII